MKRILTADCLQYGLLICLALFSPVANFGAEHPPQRSSDEQMLVLLQSMVAADPSQADSWRLIGRIFRKQNRTSAARDAFRRALAIQSDNVAAHFDLAETLAQTGDRKTAAWHYDRVMSLAPESSYASQLVKRGIQPAARKKATSGRSTSPAEARPVQFALGELDLSLTADPEHVPLSGDIELAGYEVQTFDGADDLERRVNQLKSDAIEADNRLRIFIEFGTLYNTNVTLTPISRELADSNGTSVQAFLSPDVEWIALKKGVWRAGPLFRGYFTLNEGDFQSLNLSSIQPGGFVERDLPAWGESHLIGRAEYVNSLDLLDGKRFAQRHAVTFSLTSILPNTDVVYGYVTGAVSDFAQDGIVPVVSSLDGNAVTAGISRFFQSGCNWMPTWSVGAGVETANTEGADFRYRAINLHGDATLQINPRLEFIPQGGVGYRNYGDFTGPISRDEITWRVAGRLRWKCSDTLWVSTVVGHDRFASKNDNFDTKRTEAGIVMTILR